MANYSSREVELTKPAETVYDTLIDFDNLRNVLASGAGAGLLPDDKREMLEKVEVTADTISFPGGPVGNVTLRKGECVRPVLITLDGVGTPVKLALKLELASDGDDRCKARVVVDIDIPMMLKPMVGGPLQKLVDGLADGLGNSVR